MKRTTIKALFALALIAPLILLAACSAEARETSAPCTNTLAFHNYNTQPYWYDIKADGTFGRNNLPAPLKISSEAELNTYLSHVEGWHRYFSPHHESSSLFTAKMRTSYTRNFFNEKYIVVVPMSDGNNTYNIIATTDSGEIKINIPQDDSTLLTVCKVIVIEYDKTFCPQAFTATYWINGKRAVTAQNQTSTGNSPV